MDIHPPLLDLLGCHWHFDAPVAAMAWSRDGSFAAFGLDDGTVALARGNWEGGPDVHARTAGGLEVRPPSVASPPVSRSMVQKGACRALTADLEAGFLSGGDDGRVVQIGREGTADRTMWQGEQRIERLAAGRTGRWACAMGPRVIVAGAVAGRSRDELSLPADASALAFDPSGDRFAAAYRDGANIWPSEGAPRGDLRCCGLPRALAWKPDGAWPALGLELGSNEGAVCALRLADGADFLLEGRCGPVRSLSFSADGRLLSGSGAPRVLYWRADPLDLANSGECGLPSSRAPVCAVASHPTRPLVAAGYASGAILLCRPGSADVLFIKAAGGGEVLALAWSADGQRLAFATQDSQAGIVFLPDPMFRDGVSAASGVGPRASAAGSRR